MDSCYYVGFLQHTQQTQSNFVTEDDIEPPRYYVAGSIDRQDAVECQTRTAVTRNAQPDI